jgi:hypothetical protein
MRLITKSRAVNVEEIIVPLIHKDHICTSICDTPINWKMYVDDYEFHVNLIVTFIKPFEEEYKYTVILKKTFCFE